ncbi:MAG TPA: hypothetical protein VGF26_06975 [Ramlibacter sp.]
MPDRLLRAMSHPAIDHRGPEFGALGRSLRSASQPRECAPRGG